MPDTPMILNAENTTKVGRTVTVKDAYGRELAYDHVIEVDQRTGRVTRLMTNAEGQVLVSPSTGELLREDVYPPGPLQVEVKGGEEQK